MLEIFSRSDHVCYSTFLYNLFSHILINSLLIYLPPNISGGNLEFPINQAVHHWDVGVSRSTQNIQIPHRKHLRSRLRPWEMCGSRSYC